MAKASRTDLDMAQALCAALDALQNGCEPIARADGGRDRVDLESGGVCRTVLEQLLGIAARGSLWRVVMGLEVLLDPTNEIVDQVESYLELHPRLRRAVDLVATVAATTEEFRQWQHCEADAIEGQEADVEHDHNRMLDALQNLGRLARAWPRTPEQLEGEPEATNGGATLAQLAEAADDLRGHLLAARLAVQHLLRHVGGQVQDDKSTEQLVDEVRTHVDELSDRAGYADAAEEWLEGLASGGDVARLMGDEETGKRIAQHVLAMLRGPAHQAEQPAPGKVAIVMPAGALAGMPDLPPGRIEYLEDAPTSASAPARHSLRIPTWRVDEIEGPFDWSTAAEHVRQNGLEVRAAIEPRQAPGGAS